MRTFTFGAVASVGCRLLAGEALAQGDYPILDHLAAMPVRQYQGENRNG